MGKYQICIRNFVQSDKPHSPIGTQLWGIYMGPDEDEVTKNIFRPLFKKANLIHGAYVSFQEFEYPEPKISNFDLSHSILQLKTPKALPGICFPSRMDNYRFVCDICGRTFFTIESLDSHQSWRHIMDSVEESQKDSPNSTLPGTIKFDQIKKAKQIFLQKFLNDSIFVQTFS